MARHKRNYCGELFTKFVGFKCTPSQQRELAAAVGRQSMKISDFLREIVLAYLSNIPPALATHHDAETKLRALTSATHAVNAVGNLLNQIARYVHTVRDLGPFEADLREAIRTCERVAAALHAAAAALIAAG